MTPKRKQRLILVSLMVVGAGLAVTLALVAFKDSITLFHSPSEVASGAVETGRSFRIGGMVVDGSVLRSEDTLAVQFDVTDTAAAVTVKYDGILPDLFREGQGIVALGKLGDNGQFMASQVLAKHDENYMPPEVADALEKAGHKPTTTEDWGVKTLVQP